MMARRDRTAGGRPLKRRVGTRRPRKTLLVFCEGERTEPEYLDAMKNAAWPDLHGLHCPLRIRRHEYRVRADTCALTG